MSAPEYRRVSPRIWRDPELPKANPDDPPAPEDMRSLANYLLTCEQRRTEGLFVLPRGYAAVDLGWNEVRINVAWEKLAAIGFLEEDERVQLVFLPKALRYQSVDVPNHVKSVIKHVRGLPPSHLVARLQAVAEECSPKLAKALEGEYELPPAPEPEPEPAPDLMAALKDSIARKPEPELEPEPEPPKPEQPKPKPEDDTDETFALFWEGPDPKERPDLGYPRRNRKRIGRKQARAVWGRMKPAERDAATSAVEHYRAACEEKLTIAKDAHRWLRDECWDEWDEPAVPDSRRATQSEINRSGKGLVL